MELSETSFAHLFSKEGLETAVICPINEVFIIGERHIYTLKFGCQIQISLEDGNSLVGSGSPCIYGGKYGRHHDSFSGTIAGCWSIDNQVYVIHFATGIEYRTAEWNSRGRSCLLHIVKDRVVDGRIIRGGGRKFEMDKGIYLEDMIRNGCRDDHKASPEDEEE